MTAKPISPESDRRRSPLRLLLLEDSRSDVLLLQEMLGEVSGREYEVTHVETLAAGQGKICGSATDCALLDLFLPDAEKLEGLAGLQAVAPKVPIVVLTGLADFDLGIQAVQEGAQDFMFKGQIDGRTLDRSLCYAIERKRIQEELKDALEQRDQYVEQLRKVAEVLPMCTRCGSIRPSGRWFDVNDYLSDETTFLRDDLCPACYRQRAAEKVPSIPLAGEKDQFANKLASPKKSIDPPKHPA